MAWHSVTNENQFKPTLDFEKEVLTKYGFTLPQVPPRYHSPYFAHIWGGGDIECCRPWRDSVCVICNDSGKIDGLPPNRLYGHTDFLAGSFVVCGNGGEDFISLTDRQVFLYERLYHNPVVFLPTPHGLLPMKCTPEQYEQFQRDGNKLKIKPIDHGDR
jgi:hypothetical protein